MVILKNDIKTFDQKDFAQSFLKDKETDCILYSKEGIKFNIHRQLFGYTKLMRNILKNAENTSKVEIICPCSENELENVVNFLYTGTIYGKKETELMTFQENLIGIFGFPEDLNFAKTSLITEKSFPANPISI